MLNLLWKCLSLLLIFLSLLILPKSAQASNLFNDNFDDNDGTTLSSHNHKWFGISGLDHAEIFDNQAISINSNSAYVIPDFALLTNYCVQDDFHFPFVGDFIGLSTRGNGLLSSPQHYFASINKFKFVNIGINSTGLYLNSTDISDGSHTFKFCSTGNNHSVFIDNNLIATVIDSSYTTGFPGIDLANNNAVDNFVVTPIVTNSSLPVPLIKQTSIPWKNKIYDSANVWNPRDPSINTWGCALTSAVMVFNYDGIKKLPNGKTLDPGALNDWLKTQKDGYIGNGSVNWLALSRLSKLSINVNGITNFDGLEFTKAIPGSVSNITDDLGNNIPDILGEPGHFVVAAGNEGNNIKINDPYYSRTSLADYNNSLTSLNKFTPSHTDLSYILITSNTNVNTILKDGSNTQVGQSFAEDAITNPTNPAQSNSSNLKITYLPKPTGLNYKLEITSAQKGTYPISIYFYDKDGNVFEKTENVVLQKNQTQIIPIHFDSQTNLYPNKVSYNDLQADLTKYFRNKTISTDLFGVLTTQQVIARTEKGLGQDELTLQTLFMMEDAINKGKGTKIQEPAYSALLYDLNYLETHI